MIGSAEEFVRLRTSADLDEQHRASDDPMPDPVWRELLDEHPELGSWLAHNKSVPIWVLQELACASDPRTRSVVANKRKLDRATLEVLVADPDDDVRLRVAYNAKAPRDILLRLTADPCARVSEVATTRLDQRR